MKLYHTTTLTSAKSIQRKGFKDGQGYYGFSTIHKGVFFSDTISNSNDFGVKGIEEPTALFIVDIPKTKINNYEWQEYGRSEWCIPAKLVNKYFIDRTIYSIDDESLY